MRSNAATVLLTSHFLAKSVHSFITSLFCCCCCSVIHFKRRLSFVHGIQRFSLVPLPFTFHQLPIETHVALSIHSITQHLRNTCGCSPDEKRARLPCHRSACNAMPLNSFSLLLQSVPRKKSQKLMLWSSDFAFVLLWHTWPLRNCDLFCTSSFSSNFPPLPVPLPCPGHTLCCACEVIRQLSEDAKSVSSVQHKSTSKSNCTSQVSRVCLEIPALGVAPATSIVPAEQQQTVTRHKSSTRFGR